MFAVFGTNVICFQELRVVSVRCRSEKECQGEHNLKGKIIIIIFAIYFARPNRLQPRHFWDKCAIVYHVLSFCQEGDNCA